MLYIIANVCFNNLKAKNLPIAKNKVTGVTRRKLYTSHRLLTDPTNEEAYIICNI